jgi:hypothetical protein
MAHLRQSHPKSLAYKHRAAFAGKGFWVCYSYYIFQTGEDSPGMNVQRPSMRRSLILILLFLLFAGAAVARAQAVPAAVGRQFSITAGGMASAFQPDYLYCGWFCLNSSNPYPVANSSNQAIFGVGAFVDVKFTRWVQIEAEGRWQRFNQFGGIREDNYLIGPRLPLFREGRSTVYAKALGGYSNMYFGTGNGNGQFTTLAFGGGLDVKVTRRISLRAADFEYQYWPTWGDSTLSPYGVSMGISYKIF